MTGTDPASASATPDRPVRTRFAPSPTGDLHIGGVRTALFSWLYARHCEGEFLLRIEDTDRKRSTEEAIAVILTGLRWLGLIADQPPVLQSQRLDRHKKAIQQLLDADKAYRCYCTPAELARMREQAMADGGKPRYDGRCRDRADKPAALRPVIRFKNPPAGEVVIDDLIQGRVVYRNAELDDLIIARADGSPTYNLSVVVDDADMQITHVIRGDDHLNNTPRQINIFRALGQTPPHYAHLPLILGPDGSKLSKRDGSTSILACKAQGLLPSAVLNYLVRLGWSHGDQEIFSLAEMIALFDVRQVNKSAAALNLEKLAWLNQHYMKISPVADLLALAEAQFERAGVALADGPGLTELLAVQKERVKNLQELVEQSRFFYEDIVAYDKAAAKKHLRPAILPAMELLAGRLAALTEWTGADIKAVIDTLATELNMNMGRLAQPLRVAVTGGAISPGIDMTLALLGPDKVQQRLHTALEYIRRRARAG